MVHQWLKVTAAGVLALSLVAGTTGGVVQAEELLGEETLELLEEEADPLSLDQIELDNSTEEWEIVEETEEDVDNEEEEDSDSDCKERIVTVKGSRVAVDTFRGVKALYRSGGNDGSHATYSCAAFVKRFYSKAYNVTVNNLLAGHTPMSSKGSFKKVSSAKEGDIVATTSGSGNHWAIVKKVNKNGTLTLIEQNWKWQQGGKTVAKVNRKVKAKNCKIYRLKK